MTKRKVITAPADPADREKVLQISAREGQSNARALADVGLDPKASAMVTTRAFNKGSFGELSLTDTYDGIRDGIRKFETGDHSAQRAMLISQSIALNAIFTEMSRRAALNMGDYINASERYMPAGSQSPSAMSGHNRSTGPDREQSYADRAPCACR